MQEDTIPLTQYSSLDAYNPWWNDGKTAFAGLPEFQQCKDRPDEALEKRLQEKSKIPLAVVPLADFMLLF